MQGTAEGASFFSTGFAFFLLVKGIYFVKVERIRNDGWDIMLVWYLVFPLLTRPCHISMFEKKKIGVASSSLQDRKSVV